MVKRLGDNNNLEHHFYCPGSNHLLNFNKSKVIIAEFADSNPTISDIQYGYVSFYTSCYCYHAALTHKCSVLDQLNVYKTNTANSTITNFTLLAHLQK